jgi:transcriptional regulator with XRE-family HTH domain
MSALGLRIKELRLLREKTQEEIGDEIGATKHVISNWERGKANPDPDQIYQVSRIIKNIY